MLYEVLSFRHVSVKHIVFALPLFLIVLVTVAGDTRSHTSLDANQTLITQILSRGSGKNTEARRGSAEMGQRDTQIVYKIIQRPAKNCAVGWMWSMGLEHLERNICEVMS